MSIALVDYCIQPLYTNKVRIIREPINFEWDSGNLDKNFLKHGVSNQEAEQVFINKPNLTLKDVKHSLIEVRFMIWGISNNGRNLNVVFTKRDDKIRIISARDMNRKEKQKYEKQF